MPELPEVEVIKQSLDKKIKFQKINKVLVRNRNLRFKVSKNFKKFLMNKTINKMLEVTGKYQDLLTYESKFKGKYR